MLLIREDDVQKILTMDKCIQAVEESYRQFGKGTGSNLPRQNLWIGQPKSVKLAAAALVDSGIMGISAYSAGFGRKGSGSSSTLLYNTSTGKLVAMVESRFLGWYRTGGTSAVAAKYLAPEDSETLAVIGTGRQAQSQILALKRVLVKLRSVRAFSRTRERRQEFARTMGKETGLEIHASDSAEECVKGADVIVTITTSQEPVLKWNWIRKGALISAMGSHSQDATEIDPETATSSRVIVDSREQALLEKGEILVPIRMGLASKGIIAAELGEIVCGLKKARTTQDENVLFCSGGISLEQVGVAAGVYAEATHQKIGLEL